MFILHLAYKRFESWDLLTAYCRYLNGDSQVSRCVRLDEGCAVNDP